MSWETEAERQNYIAIAQQHAAGAIGIAGNHARATLGQAAAQSERIIETANINASQISSTAMIESESIFYQSVAQVGVINAEAYHLQELYRLGAIQQSGVIAHDSAFDVSVISASSDAGYRSDIGVANVRSSEASDLASIDVGRITGEADIRISVLTAEARSTQSSEVEVAKIRAAGIADEATVRVAQYQADSTSAAIATASLASDQAREPTAIARIRAQQVADSDYWEIYYISGEANNSASTSRAVTRYQLSEISESSRNQIRRDLALTTIAAKYETDQANSDASVKRYGADVTHVAAKYQADSQSNEEHFAVDTQIVAAKYRADTDLYSDKFGADRGLQQQKRESDDGRTGRLASANAKSADDKYGADSRYSGIVLHEVRENARLLKRLRYADRHFDEAWSLIGELGPSGEIPAGFQSVTPSVSVSGTYTRSQMQMHANTIRARSAVEAYSQWSDAREDASGRGLSGSSPFLIGVRMSAESQALAQAISKEAELRVAVATENAAAILKRQSLASDTFVAQQRAWLSVEANGIRRQVGLVDGAFRVIGSVV